MDTDRSVRQALPAFLAPVPVVVGVAAMMMVAALASRFGVRPALLAAESALVLPGLLGLLLFGIPVASSLGLRSVPLRTVALSLATGVALWVLSLGLFETQYLFWPPPEGYLDAFRRLHEALRPRDARDALFSVAAIAVAPAVCEEILFRGIVLPSLRTRLPPAMAILGSALLFGLIHVDTTGSALTLYRVPFAFAVGIGLGALRMSTGSLLPPVLAHALLNTTTFVVAAREDLTKPPEPQAALGAALLAGGLAATYFLLRLITRHPPAPDPGSGPSTSATPPR